MKYNGGQEYTIEIAGMKRVLPIIEIEKGKLWIASFVMLGDTELNYKCAQEIISKFPTKEFDYIIVPESKAIPLVQSICQLFSEKGKPRDYIVLRKSIKTYMINPAFVDVKSITTAEKQKLVFDGKDAEKIKGKRVVLIDDVISTGESYRAMIKIVKNFDAEIIFAGAILKEGEFDISDIEKSIGGKIIFLKRLPVFEI